MGSGGLFHKVFGRKGLGEAFAPPGKEVEMLHPALAAELLRFDHYAQGFGRRAVRYVATGDGTDLLAAMMPLARQNHVHNTPYQQAKSPLYKHGAASDQYATCQDWQTTPCLPCRARI
jgi:hypothetical protein